MFAPITLALDPTRWDLWLIAGAGLAGMCLVLLLGRTAFASPQAAPAPAPAPVPPTETPVDHDPFLEGSAAERRASLRRRGRLIRVLIATADASATLAEGLVIDRSTGGLCLALEREIPASTVVSVRPADAPATLPWTQVEVRNGRAQPGGWEIGCAFVKTPSWGVLLHFG